RLPHGCPEVRGRIDVAVDAADQVSRYSGHHPIAVSTGAVNAFQQMAAAPGEAVGREHHGIGVNVRALEGEDAGPRPDRPLRGIATGDTPGVCARMRLVQLVDVERRS